MNSDKKTGKLNRRGGLYLLIFCVAMLMAGALLTFIFDPWLVYRKPKHFYGGDSRYLYHGIAKYYDYDAVIMGTSMTENFKPSEADALFGVNSVKLSFLGGTYPEIDEALKLAYESGNDIKLVIRGLDMSDFTKFPDASSRDASEYPFYLYDDNKWNDCLYLFNSYTFQYTLENVWKYLRGEPDISMDEYGSWSFEAGKKAVITCDERDPDTGVEQFNMYDHVREGITQNISINLLDTIKAHPETQFYIFYPPYSVAYYDQFELAGGLLSEMQQQELVARLLLQCDNVRLFSYCDNFDLVTNLDLYRDRNHYIGEVNSLILQWMSEGKGELTLDNLDEYISSITEFYLNYDYNSLYE